MRGKLNGRRELRERENRDEGHTIFSIDIVEHGSGNADSEDVITDRKSRDACVGRSIYKRTRQ